MINLEKDFISWFNDNGLFSDYYRLAYNKVKNLSLEKKISQILLVRYPYKDGIDILKKHQFGGYVFLKEIFIIRIKMK